MNLLKKNQNLLIYAILAVVTFITYTQVLYNQFTEFDDPSYIFENPHVKMGMTLNSIRWAFTTFSDANWHPLTWLSHMLDCQFFGINPVFHHLTTLLLHIANTLLLFTILKMMTNAPWRSAFVAALFALHPAHVESVAWASERKDILSTLFWMLTTFSYIRYAKKPSAKWYITSIILFTLGLMAKPMLVTLPFVLLLLDYWPLKRIENITADKTRLGWLIFEKIPLFILAAASSIITFIAQKTQGAVADFEELPLLIRLPNSIASYIKYITKMFWPDKLALYYPYDDLIPLWQTAVFLSILIGISILIIRLSRTKKYLLVGWFWYLGTLVPVIGLVQVGGQGFADRYTYIPYIGLFIIISWLATELFEKLPHSKIILTASSLIILSALSVRTHFQLLHWRDGTTIFEHTAKVTKNNMIMYYALGGAYGKLDQYPKAIEAFQKAIEINPNYAPAYCNLGVIYGKMKQYDKTIELCQKALELKPDYADAYDAIGGAYLGMEQYEKAEQYCKKAIEINPNLSDAYFNLGITYNKIAKYPQAVDSLKLAIKYNPENPEPYINLGIIYGKIGLHKETLEIFEKASKLKPDSAEIYVNLAVAYSSNHQLKESIQACQQAIKLKPYNPEAYYTIGHSYGQLKMYKEAIDAFKKTIEIQPNHIQAHYNLGYAYLLIGNKNLAQKQHQILEKLDTAWANQLLKEINNNQKTPTPSTTQTPPN